jgi:hypothetical protein
MTDDDELMSELRRIGAQVDPVPELVVDNARAALLTRRIDEELAELLLDSAVESGQVRGDQERLRLLSFQLAELSLEVQVEYAGEQVSLRGLVDGMAGEIDLEAGGEHRTMPIDADGEFTAQLPRGAARFRLRAHDGRFVTTSWVLL